MTSRVEPINGIVPAIFSTRQDAEAALEELRSIGYRDDDMGVMISDPRQYHLLDDSTDELFKGVGQGTLIGAPIGALAGIAIAALATPGVGVIGVGGLLLIGGGMGALWGTISGAQAGLATEIRHLEDVEKRYRIDLEPHEIMVVVVTDPERRQQVCDIVHRHNARCIHDHHVAA